MEQMIVAFEVVTPVFLLILIGYFLRYRKMIDEHFIKMAMKLVFTICLPASLFLKVSQSDIEKIFEPENIKFSIFTFLLIIALFFIIRVVSKTLVDEKSRGAFVQGAFRSNYIIIGYTILFSLYGDIITNRVALLVIVVVPLYNVLAIWVLSENHQVTAKENALIVLNKVIRNPLIIGIALGIVMSAFKVNIPVIASSTFEMLGKVGTPLGLIGIGGYFTLNNLKSVKVSVISALYKVLISPVIALILAYLLGFSQVDATLIFIIFGSPSAISSFIMTTAMDGDSQMASNIVIISTAMSLITLIGGLSFIGILFA